jgi:flagellar basal-body rod modification protein FlgD
MNIQGFTPAINAPLQAQASSTSGTSGSSGSGSGNSMSAGNLQATFLNLLVTELQNQDPTQPVDPTQMVAQMVSLNQLDQLILINQNLQSIAGTGSTGTSGTGTSGTGTSGTGTQGSVVSNPVGAATASTGAATTPGTVFGTQPASMSNLAPGGLMNLFGNIPAANVNSSYATQGGR